MIDSGKYLGVLAGLALALILALSPRSSDGSDPDLTYSTIHTEHFNIHFHQGLERTARLVAAIAEEVHDELTVLLGWEVDGPTELLLTDRTDSANGLAMASPRPFIQLYVTGPIIDLDDSGLSNHSHWMRTLITHEYTHVIHLQMHGGVARVINAVFGDVYLPNQMQPTWFIEGMAVMEETYRTGAGRIRSSTYRMTMRTHALEGTLRSLGEVSNFNSEYPHSAVPYIYGAMFVDYLRGRFGEGKLAEICAEYGSATLPYGMNRIFKKVLGVDLDTLYDEWIAHLKEDAERTRAELERVGLTPSTRITSDGGTKGRPLFAPGGDRLLVPVASGDERSGIYSIPLDGGARSLVAYADGQATLSMDRAGHIYYSRTAPHKNWYRYYDVFSLAGPRAEPVRITHGARAREAAVSGSGDRIAMTLNQAGTSRLVVTDSRGNPLRTLVDSAPDDQVYTPVWSPDDRLIAAVLREGDRVDLFSFDARTGERHRLTDDRAIEGMPFFDPSGRYLLFASDRSGISNIYALDLEDRTLLQITNVLGGAVSPAVSPDGGRIAFLNYSSVGWDAHVMPFDPANPVPLSTLEGGIGDAGEIPRPAGASIVPYNPLPSLLPRSWMLGMTAGADQWLMQVVVGVNDAASLHAVAAELDFGVVDHALTTRVAYSYYGMSPAFGVGFNRQIIPKDTGYIVGGEARPWDQELLMGTIGLSATVPGLDRSHTISASYSITHARPRNDLDVEYDPSGELPDLPDHYFRAGLSIGWAFSDTVESVFGVSSEDGRRLSAGASLYHPALGGEQKLVGFRWSWAEFQEAPWLDHHVFALRLAGGVYVSDPPEQASYSAGGYSEQNLVDALWNNIQMDLPSIRGYAPGSLNGDQIHSLRLEYRFPLWWAEAAYKTLPLFFRRLHAAVFTDNMLITFDGLDTDDWYSSVGAELVWSIFFGYYLPITLRTGFARGLMAGGGNEVIVVMGGTF
jgi:WD40 repeat protein